MKKHNQNNLTVVKHNHLNQASYKLTLDERRLILSSIALINPRNEMPAEITIQASDYAYQWGINETNAYMQLKEARANLFERKIKMVINGEVDELRWVYRAKYADGQGYIKLSFSPDIKPYLSQLKSHFTSYRLTEVKSFKSGHAIRLYELLMQFKESGWYVENLHRLKEKFGVENNYDRWVDFKKNVIDIAVKEINLNTNYQVKYDAVRRGRKINQVKFYFGLNPQADMFK